MNSIVDIISVVLKTNLVACSSLLALQTVYCKPATPVKKGHLEITGTATF